MEELYRIALPEGVSTSLGARYTAEATTGLLHAWVCLLYTSDAADE